VRIRAWPKPSRSLLALALALLALACVAALDHAAVAASVLGGGSVFFAGIAVRGCTAAAGAVVRAVREPAANADDLVAELQRRPALAAAFARDAVVVTELLDGASRSSRNGSIASSGMPKHVANARREDVDST